MELVKVRATTLLRQRPLTGYRAAPILPRA